LLGFDLHAVTDKVLAGSSRKVRRGIGGESA
jgi:hypothetical protein